MWPPTLKILREMDNVSSEARHQAFMCKLKVTFNSMLHSPLHRQQQIKNKISFKFLYTQPSDEHQCTGEYAKISELFISVAESASR